MTPNRFHIIHVGAMTNKGTQALLQSDVSTIREIVGDELYFSVSTTDEEGVRKTAPHINEVVPTIVDIPFKRADSLSIKLGIKRNNLRYTILVIGSMLFMFAQVVMSLLSAILMKLNLRPFYHGKVLALIKKANVVVSCSDENFRETASLLPSNFIWLLTWWSILFERTFEISIARFFGKPIVMFPNSIGPFKTRIGRFLSKISLKNCNCLLVRDSISYDILKSLKVQTKRTLTSDIVLLFKSGKTNLKFSSPIIGVSPGVYSHSLFPSEVRMYVKEHAVALDLAVDKLNAKVVFLPHFISGFAQDDLEISKLILENMSKKNQAKIVQVDTASEFKALLNMLDLLIASKMHPSVMGVSGFVPTLCVAYDNKQIGFFEDLGLTNYLLPIREVTSEKMFLKIQSMWRDRKIIREMLHKTVPPLQEKTRKAIQEAISPYVIKSSS